MTNTFNTRLMALALAAATLVGAAPVVAQSRSDTVGLTVRHGGLHAMVAEDQFHCSPWWHCKPPPIR